MRALRAIAALALGLVVVELGLRAAGFLYLQLAGRGGRSGDAPTLLCVGDSHVFGLYERAEDAYPARLEALLDAHAEGRWRVVNGGRPGESSQTLVRRIDEQLERWSPTAVLVTVGVNDSWTFRPVEAGGTPWYAELPSVTLALP